MAAKFNPPKEFDFLPENWPEWISRWSRFRTVSKLNTEEEGVQIDSLIYSMGTRAESIFSSLGLGEDEVGVYIAVKQAFEEYFAPRRYIIYERAKFFRRVQAEGESVEQFIRALNESADRCEFPDRATQIRDRIVVGMRDQTVSREMQRMDIDLLTEAKAVSMARQAEEVERQMRELTLPKSVDEVKPRRRRKPRVAPSSHQSNTKRSNSDSESGTSDSELSGPCSRCGHSKHYNGKCPAIDRKCKVCSMFGHYASCCRSKSSKPKKGRVNQLVTDASFLGEVDSNSDSWTQLVVVEGLELPVRFKLDSGADVSVVPSRLCANVTLRPTSKRLIAPGNMCITVLGEFDSVLRVGSRKHTERLYVVDETNPLLGREACVKLGLITCNVSGVSMNDSYSEFKELGQVSDEYKRQTRDLPVQSKSVDVVESPRKQCVASTQTDTNTKSEVSCPRCGYDKHYNSKCPAINVKCQLCGVTDHYARCCITKRQTRKPQYKANVNQPVVDTDRDNVSFLGELVVGRKLRSNVPAQTSKPQYKANVNQLVVDTDRVHVSFLGELVVGRKMSPNVPADTNVLQPKPLMGRKLRSTVPAHPNVLQAKLPNAVHVRQKEVELKASSKFNFDRKHRAKELPPLTVGDEVWITDLKRPAKVVDANPGTPRSYVVDSDGSTVRRNRRARRELSQSSSPHPQPACPQLEHTGVKVSRYGRTIKEIKKLDM